MNFLIKTKEFGIKKDSFHLLRSRKGYQEIPNNEIIKVQLNRRIPTKHPLRTFVFGIILIVISLFTLDGFISIINRLSMGYRESQYLGQSGRFLGAMVIMIGFLFIAGVSAIILSIKTSICLTIETVENKVEIVRLKEIIKQNRIEELASICQQIFGLSFTKKL